MFEKSIKGKDPQILGPCLYREGKVPYGLIFSNDLLTTPRKFHVRRNNDEVNYIETERIVIADHSYCWFVSLKWFKKVHAHHAFLIKIMIKFYRHYLIYKYTTLLVYFLHLGPFRDFYFNSPHPQSSKTGSSGLIKDYTDEEFLKTI